jgi:hypothetical protein
MFLCVRRGSKSEKTSRERDIDWEALTLKQIDEQRKVRRSCQDVLCALNVLSRYFVRLPPTAARTWRRTCYHKSVRVCVRARA